LAIQPICLVIDMSGELKRWLKWMGAGAIGILAVVLSSVWIPYWADPAMAGEVLGGGLIAIAGALVAWQAHGLRAERLSLQRVKQTIEQGRWLDRSEALEAPVRWAGVPGRILIVGDNPVNQVATLRAIHDLGHLAAVVALAHAPEAFESGRFDLVLVDCQGSGLDGCDVARHIRARETGTEHTAVVAMTADMAADGQEQLRAAGMDDYLAKPFRLDTLGRVVERWLVAQSRAAAPPPSNPFAETRP
jgi:CheY-like chemotaxis protein